MATEGILCFVEKWPNLYNNFQISMIGISRLEQGKRQSQLTFIIHLFILKNIYGLASDSTE